MAATGCVRPPTLLSCFPPSAALQAGALPGHWPHVTLALGQGFNLTAFALSLLLVFRCAGCHEAPWLG